jgi:hypothetical protein
MTAYLAEHPESQTEYVYKNVEGTDSRLKELLEGRPEFDFRKGAHNAKLWSLTGGSTS